MFRFCLVFACAVSPHMAQSKEQPQASPHMAQSKEQPQASPQPTVAGGGEYI